MKRYSTLHNKKKKRTRKRYRRTYKRRRTRRSNRRSKRRNTRRRTYKRRNTRRRTYKRRNTRSNHRSRRRLLKGGEVPNEQTKGMHHIWEELYKGLQKVLGKITGPDAHQSTIVTVIVNFLGVERDILQGKLVAARKLADVVKVCIEKDEKEGVKVFQEALKSKEKLQEWCEKSDIANKEILIGLTKSNIPFEVLGYLFSILNNIQRKYNEEKQKALKAGALIKQKATEAAVAGIGDAKTKLKEKVQAGGSDNPSKNTGEILSSRSQETVSKVAAAANQGAAAIKQGAAEAKQRAAEAKQRTELATAAAKKRAAEAKREAKVTATLVKEASNEMLQQTVEKVEIFKSYMKDVHHFYYLWGIIIMLFTNIKEPYDDWSGVDYNQPIHVLVHKIARLVKIIHMGEDKISFTIFKHILQEVEKIKGYDTKTEFQVTFMKEVETVLPPQYGELFQDPNELNKYHSENKDKCHQLIVSYERYKAVEVKQKTKEVLSKTGKNVLSEVAKTGEGLEEMADFVTGIIFDEI